jgi:hypothetical protein
MRFKPCGDISLVVPNRYADLAERRSVGRETLFGKCRARQAREFGELARRE